MNHEGWRDCLVSDVEGKGKEERVLIGLSGVPLTAGNRGTSAVIRQSPTLTLIQLKGPLSKQKGQPP